MSEVLQGVTERSGRLDRAVAGLFPVLSRSRSSTLIRACAVMVDGVVRVRPSHDVAAGAVVAVTLPDAIPSEAFAQDLPLDIVYEDADLAVVNKASGVVVHPSAGHPDGTLVNALLFHLEGLSGIGGVRRPGIVHRLDRGTSGLLVVAKNDAAHSGLAEQFADHSAGRRYVALVHGTLPESGTHESRLARHPHHRVRFASTDGPAGKRAVTHWRSLGVAGTVALVECRLETGRTHQIRVHLTELGAPIVGDGLYQRRGMRLPATLRDVVVPDRPLLHAWRLVLRHPRTGEQMAFERQPPEDFQAALSALGLSTEPMAPWLGARGEPAAD